MNDGGDNNNKPSQDEWVIKYKNNAPYSKVKTTTGPDGTIQEIEELLPPIIEKESSSDLNNNLSPIDYPVKLDLHREYVPDLQFVNESQQQPVAEPIPKPIIEEERPKYSSDGWENKYDKDGHLIEQRLHTETQNQNGMKEFGIEKRFFKPPELILKAEEHPLSKIEDINKDNQLLSVPEETKPNIPKVNPINKSTVVSEKSNTSTLNNDPSVTANSTQPNYKNSITPTQAKEVQDKITAGSKQKPNQQPKKQQWIK